MSEVKKDQHYVWQYYMYAWADVKRVKVLNVNEDRVFYSHSERVFQEKFFYKGNNISKSAFDNLKTYLKYFGGRSGEKKDVYAVISDIDLHIIELTILFDLKEYVLDKSNFKLQDVVIKKNAENSDKAKQTINEKIMGPLILELIKEKLQRSSSIKMNSIVESYEQIDAAFYKGVKSLNSFLNHLIEIECTEPNFMNVLDEYIEQINLDLLENLYDQYEQLSIEFIDELRSRKFNFFSNPVKKVEFMNFISMQLGRTKKTISSYKNDVIPSMDKLGRPLNSNEESLIKDLSDLSPYLYFFQSKYLVPFLDVFFNTLVIKYSDGSQDFITSDQPVVPIKSSEGLDNFEIYYPISPQIAVTLKHTNSQGITLEEDVLTETEIIHLNNRVREECKTYVILNNCKR